jgi:hypothetical protein
LFTRQKRSGLKIIFAREIFTISLPPLTDPSLYSFDSYCKRALAPGFLDPRAGADFWDIQGTLEFVDREGCNASISTSYWLTLFLKGFYAKSLFFESCLQSWLSFPEWSFKPKASLTPSGAVLVDCWASQSCPQPGQEFAAKHRRS